jgi:hypothetical protein
MRSIFAVATLALVPAAFAQSGSVKPITLPEGTQVTFELDARDDDLLAVVKQFFGADEATPAGKKKAPAKLTVPGSRNINVDWNDISALIRNIHQVRVVSYTAAGDANPIAFHEPAFASQGLRRMIFSTGDDQDTFLVMRGDGNRGLGLLFIHGDAVTVARTDGMLDMAMIGRLGRAFMIATMATPATPAAPAVKAPVAKPATKKAAVVKPTVKKGSRG